jgi:hypothetical protein
LEKCSQHKFLVISLSDEHPAKPAFNCCTVVVDKQNYFSELTYGHEICRYLDWKDDRQMEKWDKGQQKVSLVITVYTRVLVEKFWTIFGGIFFNWPIYGS